MRLKPALYLLNIQRSARKPSMPRLPCANRRIIIPPPEKFGVGCLGDALITRVQIEHFRAQHRDLNALETPEAQFLSSLKLLPLQASSSEI